METEGLRLYSRNSAVNTYELGRYISSPFLQKRRVEVGFVTVEKIFLVNFFFLYLLVLIVVVLFLV